jgi:hypothetical protein
MPLEWSDQYSVTQFVSAHGIAAACDIRPSRMLSDTEELNDPDYESIGNGDVVYVNTSQLPAFVDRILPAIKSSFVLVTGDSDLAAPGEVSRRWRIPERISGLLADPRLLHWFAQNCDRRHPNLTPIPIGLDYHTQSKRDGSCRWGPPQTPGEQDAELGRIREALPPLVDRPLSCLGNFQFSLFGDRIPCLRASYAKPFMRLQPRYMPRRDVWRSHGECSFVLSPQGNGMDCHRTWEALALNTIPIVRSSFLDPLFENLPVMIVEDWRAIDEEALLACKHHVLSRNWQLDKLHIDYWRGVFRAKKGGEGG